MVRAPVVRLAKRRRVPGAPVGAAAEPSDRELADRARAGDVSAEQALFHRHAPYVLTLSYRLLRDDAEAEDVLQDTFVDAIAHLRTSDAPVTLRAWLAGIAVHKVHRRFRRRKLQRLLGIFHAADDTVLESSADSDCAPDLRAELSLLDGALSQLDDVDRTPWVLRYVEGYGLEAVGELCGCSLATVKRRIARAQAVVARHVGFEEWDDE